ncbi:SLC13 family permease [Microbacterium schleiferi]|uniref:SLC13 family permease n=1 Tax=Microbacterium schleiferi TaxID=69362 RepID=UPI001E627225|nr:SLC13 family permease [Microbacterium schleiferi]
MALRFLTWVLLGTTTVGDDARVVGRLAILMAAWWTTEAVPLPVTSLLPIVILPMMTVRTISETAAPYANPIVLLFVGGFLIAIAMQKWNRTSIAASPSSPSAASARIHDGSCSAFRSSSSSPASRGR